VVLMALVLMALVLMALVLMALVLLVEVPMCRLSFRLDFRQEPPAEEKNP
jgi:hypothetical protein